MISKESTALYKKRARELVAQMTLTEKISQMMNKAPEIKRLGIKSYNWWNEALHGVARAGIATVFPQAIALAATFDTELVYRIGDVVSTEGRAKYNESQRVGDYNIYKGLTFWSPNINIFRDPRWGRGHETYGEDPFLTSKMGVSYIKGLQGNDTRHLKAAACIKHFIAHSGPEGIRHGFNATVSKKDFYETYLPAFAACIKEANVEAVMGAYNRVNGEICCASQKLIYELLRNKLGFDGHFVSDCGAIHDIFSAHRAAADLSEAAAMAVKAGCDLNCGSVYTNLLLAIEKGIIDEKAIDECVERLITTRIKLGILGNDTTVFDKIPYHVNDCKEHAELSLLAAKKCITLLKNDGLLPLNKKKIKTIAVIGPNANSEAVLKGNYCGEASRYYTVLDGLYEYLGDEVRIIYAPGCSLFKDRLEPCGEPYDGEPEAISAAYYADLVILCVGLDPTIEGEAGDAFNADVSGDKPDLELPGVQNHLISVIGSMKKPTVVISFSGSAVNLSNAADNSNALIQAWYPGAQGGKALAGMLFGDFSPAGRLPVTFYKSADDLPDFCDYSMEGRTYRYFTGEVLYPFGYGLSYTSFDYGTPSIDKSQIRAGDSVVCSIDVANTGSYDSDEVVQLYLRDLVTSVRSPIHQLKGFKRVLIKRGETRTVEFTISPDDMMLVLDDGSNIIEKGRFRVYIGGCQPDSNTKYVEFDVI
ncbi:MAG: glycoside hydrolase family 3 protein [Clostridiales bacterium]|jgi:beta-glucosidase|nr:glycoside hydrolase family 3 protein [Clostridiales bacterium]